MTPWIGLLLISASALSACGGERIGSAADASLEQDASHADAGGDAGALFEDSGGGGDAGPSFGDSGEGDGGPIDCTYDDGGAELDAKSRFAGSCAGGCPAGTVCAIEIGGVAGGGGEYCAPIVDRCKNDVTCACLAGCVCGSSFGRAERCTDTQQAGTRIECDNGIR